MSTWKTSTNGKCGLINIGNTCYMNSIFQILLHHETFVNYFISEQVDKDINHDKKESMVVKEYNRLVKGYWSFDDFHQIKPLSIIKVLFDMNPIFHPFRQNDAQEFLTFLLDSLHVGLEHTVEIIQKNKHPTPLLISAHEEWKKYFENKYSYIVSLYFFQTKTIMKCSNNHKSISFTPSSLLSLNIYGNCLLDCLNKHFSEEMTEYKCEQCKELCSKTEKLQYLSDYLFIQLKRFQYSYNTTNKIYTKIEYPSILDLHSFVDSSISAKHCNYQLDGIILHHGSANNGHYYAYQKLNDKWYKFDDEVVDEKSSSDILNDDNAYLLIYKKINC